MAQLKSRNHLLLGEAYYDKDLGAIRYFDGEDLHSLSRAEEIAKINKRLNTKANAASIYSRSTIDKKVEEAAPDPRDILERRTVVETSEELAVSKKAGQATLNQVFSDWERFAQKGAQTEVDPVVDHNDNSVTVDGLWSYDEASDEIKSTANAGYHCGMTSNLAYEDYVHEISIESSDSDNDFIGVVIAFAESRDTLTVVRRPSAADTTLENSAQEPYAVYFNLGRDSQKIVADGSGLVTPPGGGWAGNGRVRIRVERAGDTVKVQTGAFGSGAIDAATELAVDLSSDSDLEVFRGLSRYGYSCYSQKSATFSSRSFSRADAKIFDLSSDPPQVWGLVDQSWEVISTDFLAHLTPATLLYNPDTKRNFYLDLNGDIEPFFDQSRQRYDLGDYIDEVVSNDAETIAGALLRHSVRFTGGEAKVNAAPGSDLVIGLYKNGTQAASVTVPSGGGPSVPSGFPLDFDSGDTMRLERSGGSGATDLFYMISGLIHAA